MVIFLISGKAESGKDTFHTLAEPYVKSLNPNFFVTRLAFADEVKRVSRDMGWNGEKDENGRSGLIMVGDGARKYFDKDIWIKKVIFKLEDLLSSSNMELSQNGNRCEDIVFITDCRYPNEIDMIKDWAESNKVCAISVRVNRQGHVSKLTPEQRSNASETALDDYEFDIVVKNPGDIDTYQKIVCAIMDGFLEEL